MSIGQNIAEIVAEQSLNECNRAAATLREIIANGEGNGDIAEYLREFCADQAEAAGVEFERRSFEDSVDATVDAALDDMNFLGADLVLRVFEGAAAKIRRAVEEERQGDTLVGEVRKIVVGHLGVDSDKVTDDADFVDDLGADSLDVVELAMAFEEEFDVVIEDDEAERARTFGDAVALIRSKIEARSA
jgi:acyl carrier protein